MSKGAAAIVLDRDGVINHDSDNYVKNEDEWIPITGSMDAIAKLHQKDYQVIVATNQSGLARGYFDEVALAAIHQKLNLKQELVLRIFFSYFISSKELRVLSYVLSSKN